MVEYAKKNPGKLNFANTGPWGVADLCMRLFAKPAGIDYNNIPHDGGGLRFRGGRFDQIHAAVDVEHDVLGRAADDWCHLQRRSFLNRPRKS